MATYKILRFYYPQMNRRPRTIYTRLTLDEAKQHCNDPRTRKDGEYFEGYTEE